MLTEGMDGRLLVVSVSDPRYALHRTRLQDGTILNVKEDLWQTSEHRHMAATLGDGISQGPRFYVTNVQLSSGETINPKNARLPEMFRLHEGIVVESYVRGEPKVD